MSAKYWEGSDRWIVGAPSLVLVDFYAIFFNNRINIIILAIIISVYGSL